MPKTRRSAVMEKCQRLAGLPSRKNAKNSQVFGNERMLETRSSAVTKKYKILRSIVMIKCQKLPDLRSRKNAKTHGSPVTEKS